MEINFTKNNNESEDSNSVMELQHQTKTKRQSNNHSDPIAFGGLQAISSDQSLLEQLYVFLKKAKNSQSWFYLYLILLTVYFVACLLTSEFPLFSYYLELGCQMLFVVAMLARLLEFPQQDGFWLFIDVLSCVAGLSGYFLNMEEKRYLRGIGVLRLLFFIKELSPLRVPSRNLIFSLKSAGKIMFPAVIIIFIYSVVGLYCFSDQEYSKCRTPDNKNKPDNWTVYQEQIYLCGERQCPIVEGEQLECLNPIDYGVPPNEDELINIVQGNGLMRYSNIFYAFFLTFKQTFVTGSSRQAILNKQSSNQLFVLIYNLSFIYIVSYIYLNIFYGLLVTSDELDEKENDDSKSQAQPQSAHSFKKMEEKDVIKAEEQESQKSAQEHGEQAGFEANYEMKQLKLKIRISELDKVKEVEEAEEKTDKNPAVFKHSSCFKMAWIEPSKPQQNKLDYQNFMDRLGIFNHIVVFLSAVNVCIDYQGEPQSLSLIVSTLDFAFYCQYVLEISLTLLIKRFYYKLNTFDATEIVSIVVCLLCTGATGYEAVVAKDIWDFLRADNSVQKIFRALKYLRLIILILATPYFREARVILSSTLQTVWQLKNVVGLWFLIMFICSFMGYYFLNGKTLIGSSGHLDLINGKAPPINYDNIYNSIIMTMMAFYNEEWDYFMFQQYLGAGVLVVVWQIFCLLVGLTILSKYFMALLMKLLGEKLDQFQEVDSDPDSDGEEELLNINQEEEINSLKSVSANPMPSPKRKLQPKPSMMQGNKVVPHGMPANRRVSRVRQTIVGFQLKEINNADLKRCNQQTEHSCLFKAYLKIRKTLIIYLKSRAHLVFRSIIILCSFGLMVHASYQKGQEAVTLRQIFFKLFGVFFLLELILSLLAFGAFGNKMSYFRRSLMGIINVAVITIEIVSLTPIGSYPIVIQLLALRVLRLLSFIEMKFNSDRNMRLTIVAFAKLIPKVFNLLMVTLVMYGFFAILLVKVYKQDFYYCENSANFQIDTLSDCFNWGGDWLQRKMNVSNFPMSLLYLFLIGTTQGWSTLMLQASQIRSAMLNPREGYNNWIQIFFSLFFFFGNMIMLNVMIGLSIYNFNKIKYEVTGEAKLNKDEKTWLSIKSQIHRLQPIPKTRVPQNCIRYICYIFLTSRGYKIIKGVLFFLFSISMSLFGTGLQSQLKQLLTYILYGFVGQLVLEYIIGLIANGFQRTLGFIFQSMSLCYLGIYFPLHFFNVFTPSQEKLLVGAIIALLLIRFFSLLNDIEFLRKVFNSVITILPQTTNMLLIITIVLFIYTIIGISLFQYLKTNSQLNQYDQNYRSFTSALYALIKFSTLESPIAQIEDAASAIAPNFVCFQINNAADFRIYGQNGCGQAYKSYIFFLSFHIIYSLILMLTLMAVIVDAYSEVRRQEEALVNKFQLQQVRAEWTNYDPEAVGLLSYRDFWLFTAKLMKIYEVNPDSLSNQSKQSFLRSLNIAIYENEHGVLSFEFHQVIEALTRIFMKNKQGKADLTLAKADKLFANRQPRQAIKLKKSFYSSSDVLTLILLKSGLKTWRRKTTPKAPADPMLNSADAGLLSPAQLFHACDRLPLQNDPEDDPTKKVGENVFACENQVVDL